MKIISWPTYVNQNVLEDTSITIGDGGFVEDSNSNGFKDRRLTALAVPDKFNVVMDFDWIKLDERGLSEYDRFVDWYKYNHKRGVNPFWFPSITKHPVTSLRGEDVEKRCLYKITSALTPQPSGFSMRISMTWEEVFSGIINIPVQTSRIDKIEPHKSYVDVYYTPLIPNGIPEVADINIVYKSVKESGWSSMNPLSIELRNNRLRMHYLPFPEGVYDIYVNNNSNQTTFKV